jgi:glucokinase
MDRTVEAIQEAIDNAGLTVADIRAIGAGIPGAHRSHEGICVYSPNFADSRGVPVLAPIRQAFDLPTFMLNDVAVQTLGEHRFGAGRGCAHMIMITLGTGIGGGAIIDGDLRIGPTEGFAEVGHMTIEPDGPLCGCGNRGCWEALAGRDAIVRRAVAKLQHGRRSKIAELVDYRLGSITPALIARSADEGDAVAIEVLAETAHYLGIGVANLIQLYNPQVLVIGGGIAQAGARLFEPMMRTVRTRALMVPASTCRIVRSQLGDDAGIIGAAALASRELDRIPGGTPPPACPEPSPEDPSI